MLECVINVSEGRRLDVVELIARNGGRELLDLHTDADHHRSVITVVGESAARAVTTAAVLALDLRDHTGVHPRLGVVDVVPFVPFDSAPLDSAPLASAPLASAPLASAALAPAREARDRFGEWLAAELGVPSFRYGPERSLPEVRRRAFVDLAPDFGPAQPHPTAGATALGARPVLVAYNVWLTNDDLEEARRVATAVRGPHVRALGLPVAGRVQVSMNLIDPDVVGPDAAYDAVAARAPVERAELVGLIPATVLDRIPPDRWAQLDLSMDRTIESRLAASGIDAD